MRLLPRVLSAVLPFALGLASAVAGAGPPGRRVVIQASPGIPSQAVDAVAAGARARGIEIRVAPEVADVEAGYVLLRMSTIPASAAVHDAVQVFPIRIERAGFTFDGRRYFGVDEAVRLNASTGGEVIVLGNSPDAVLALAGRWLATPGSTDYEVASGAVARDGQFERRDGRLVVDRASDRDRIAERDAFLGALKRRTRGGIVWEYPDAAQGAAAKWEKIAARFLRKGRLTVRVYPDAVTKATLTGSARPADLTGDAGAVRVDLDGSAPAQPDLVTPVLAAAGLAAADPSLLKRPVLLAAGGARRAGRWWGREVKTFAAFTRAAAVDPSIAAVLASAASLSPVLDVGTVASWLDAGARLESESAVEKSLGRPDAALAPLLDRWRTWALRQTVQPPPRRPLPAAFLRGVSYPSPEGLEDAFVSARSREALAGLASAGFGSIALRPGALVRDPEGSEILFVRHGARGETDEGVVHAIEDAHAAGMTAAVMPELVVAGGSPAAEIAMASEAGWSDWFYSYRRFLVHEAVVAEAAGADVLVVGAGLTSTEEQKNQWKQAIAAARLATGAALTYGAAATAAVADVPFWDGLDAIGVQFLEPLARTEKASDAMLVEGARAGARPLMDLSKRLGKPVVFTRAGYPPVQAAWMTPSDGSGRPASPADAARAIEAVYRALSGQAWWRGVYWPRFDASAAPAEQAVVDGFRRIEAGAP